MRRTLGHFLPNGRNNCSAAETTGGQTPDKWDVFIYLIVFFCLFFFLPPCSVIDSVTMEIKGEAAEAKWTEGWRCSACAQNSKMTHKHHSEWTPPGPFQQLRLKDAVLLVHSEPPAPLCGPVGGAVAHSLSQFVRISAADQGPRGCHWKYIQKELEWFLIINNV